jgi:hypothetical protein
MRRILATLAVIVSLFAIALPAQASATAPNGALPDRVTGHRYHLGHVATDTERARFGCGTDGHAEAFLLHHNGHWTIAPRGTVKHPNRIRAACSSATPMAGRILTRLFPADPICDLVPSGGPEVAQISPTSPNPCDPQGYLPCLTITQDAAGALHCNMPPYEDPH